MSWVNGVGGGSDGRYWGYMVGLYIVCYFFVHCIGGVIKLSNSISKWVLSY